MGRASLSLLLTLIGAGACTGHITGGVYSIQAVDGGNYDIQSGTGGMIGQPDARNGTGGMMVGSGGSPATTCGNGRLDPGEDCDGSNLNSGSCSSLGFLGGTLACATSCVFNTGACTSGPMTPKINVSASRTTCVAPCGVFFDATGTTGLQGGDYVLANFNWDFDSTNVDPNGSHEKTIGFGVGHVFEIPGTYQVSVRVRDSAGNSASATVPITVSAMGGTTYYVASNGSDSNSGTDASHPFQTVAKGITKFATNVSVLLRKGDTFTLPESTGNNFDIKVTGPFLLGAYTDPNAQSSAAPILSTHIGGTNDTSGVADLEKSASDIRLVDLHIKSTTGTFIGADIASNNTLLLRVEQEGIGWRKSDGTAQGENLQVESGTMGLFVVDCNFHDFIGYGIFGGGAIGFAWVGTSTVNFTGADHAVRVQTGTLTYIADSTCTASDTGSDSTFDCYTIRGDNDKSVVVNNTTNRNCAFSPQNTSVTESVQNGLFEGNVVNDSRPSTASGNPGTSLLIHANHIVARNNLFLNSLQGIDVSGFPNNPANWVDNIFVYNNTMWYPASGDSTVAVFVYHHATTGSVTIENNIFYNGTKTGSFVLADTGANSGTEDHNLTYAPNYGAFARPTGAGDVYGDPLFVSVDPANANAFRLSAASPAIGTGTTVPAYQDSVGVLRAVGSAFDMGAFQYSP